MGASLSSVSSNFFNNTTSLPLNQKSLTVIAPAKPDQTPIDIMISTRDSASTGDNQAKSYLECIAEQVHPMAIAIAGGVITLLANTPTSVHNLIIPYKMYLLFYLLSFSWSIVPLLVTLTTKPSRGVAWLQKQAMKIAIVFIVISVTLRIFLLLPPPIVWYEVLLIPLLVVGAISLYLWYGWIKAKNSTQTSPAVSSSFSSEV